MQESDLQAKLGLALGDRLLGAETLGDRIALVVRPDGLFAAVTLLRSDPETLFDMLFDLAGADYSTYPEKREYPICVSYQLYSTKFNSRAWLKSYLPADKPEIDSITGIYAGANWYERECWDMYGVVFKGHPYLKRLLLYEEFVGHPLRKDYPILKMQPLIPMRNAVDYEAVAVRNRRDSEEGA